MSKYIQYLGPSGGGKTTIVSLLEMFYYPDSGNIYLDGHDMKSLDPQFFRRHIGVVSQEPMLFGTTIAKNIAYGMPDISLEKIIAVLPFSFKKISPVSSMPRWLMHMRYSNSCT